MCAGRGVLVLEDAHAVAHLLEGLRLPSDELALGLDLPSQVLHLVGGGRRAAGHRGAEAPCGEDAQSFGSHLRFAFSQARTRTRASSNRRS